jgi:hypothetical protein
MSPPRKPAGSSRPSRTSASVTAGSVPPRPYDAGPGSAPADSGPTFKQPELVDAGEAAAAGADLDEVDRRHRHREARPLLEAVDAGHLEGVGELGLAVLDQARLGGGAAHVEAQQPVLAEARRTRSRRAHRRPGRTRRAGSGSARRRRPTPRHRSTASSAPTRRSPRRRATSAARRGTGRSPASWPRCRPW